MTSSIALWADSGPHIGFGHVARCCAIGRELRKWGAKPALVLPDGAGVAFAQANGLDALVESAGFAAFAAAAPRAGAVVVDSYRVRASALAELRATGTRVVALDDTASSVPPVDLVINGAPGAERLDYPLRKGTQYLLGPRYCPLRQEFRSWPEKVIADRVSCVLASVGGEDVSGVLGSLMASAAAVFSDAAVVGVCGTKLHTEVAGDVRVAPADYPELVRSADVMICGGGQTLIEAVATGMPAVAVILGEDQRPQLSAIAAAGAVIEAGPWAVDEPGSLERQVCAALEGVRPAGARVELSRRGRLLIDGDGAQRIAAAVLRLASGLGVEPE